jgi:hypothetical protein
MSAVLKRLEERAWQGADLKETANFAQSLIETDLIPDFREFQRQLRAVESRKWGKVLDAAGKIVEIDAAPWSPNFWALLAHIFLKATSEMPNLDAMLVIGSDHTRS